MKKQMDVKTVDFSDPEAGKKFTNSLKETGFAIISNHPISFELIDKAFDEWKVFFNSQEKHDYLFEKESQAGYFPFRSENAKGAKQKDLKEFFHYYHTTKLPSACPSTVKIFSELNQMATTLLSWIEKSVPDTVNFTEPLSKMIQDSPQTLLRPIHYPPLSGDEEPAAIRAAAHEDINLITLLPASTAPGLQVQDNNGFWHDVKCDKGTLAVNSGDMLKEASQHYFPSTTHQVINPEGSNAKAARLSMPLFLHPRLAVKLSDKYTADEYLKERLRELGLI